MTERPKTRAKRVCVSRAPGLTSTPEYRAWQTMRHRCTSPKSPAWARYGGRGITICERWLNSPETFLADMGPRPTPKHEIDRIDNNAGYSPENCRWVDRKTNDRNRRSNRMIKFRGELLTSAEWCERFGIPRDTFGYRLRTGWTVEMALTTAVRAKRPNGSGWRTNPKPIAVPRWTADEDAVVREVYPVGGIAALRVALPQRSHRSLEHRVTKLRVCMRPLVAANAPAAAMEQAS